MRNPNKNLNKNDSLIFFSLILKKFILQLMKDGKNLRLKRF